MKQRKTERTFKGYDFSELFGWLGVDTTQDEQPAINDTKEKIKNLYSLCSFAKFKGTDEEYKKLQGIRTFVLRLSEYESSAQSLWKGLYVILDDATFLKYVLALLEYMWN